MSKSIRARQIADVIHTELANQLQKEVADPRLAKINITHVTVSPDLGHARIYFTLVDKQDLPQVEAALKKASGFLRHNLASNIKMRYVPTLRFIYDESLAYANKISDLLDDTKSNASDE